MYFCAVKGVALRVTFFFFFINNDISSLCGMNVMLMQHLPVIKHSEEINGVNFLAIDLALPLLIKMSL